MLHNERGFWPALLIAPRGFVALAPNDQLAPSEYSLDLSSYSD